VSVTIIVDDFEKLLSVRLSQLLLRELLGRRNQLQFVGLSDDLSGLGSLHSAFCQVARLIIKQTV
jgi:hypothetical protein